MPQQLIFTSAVRGITPGSSGYCTVARSVEMREGLVSRLEQLSVYQHLQSGVNPMVLSHRIISLRGTIFHVLTRTADAGLDYTNRTNFIAHHVVFQPHELHGACSPADFILYWPGWLSGWEGDPGWTDDQAASFQGVQNTTSLPAENWAGWSGNAGNASLLFESGKARDAALVAEPGQESALVYLFAESLILLNGDHNGKGSQWQVPFTTFFQSKDEVADFRWRGIWPEVNRAKAERGALVLDLRNPSSFPLTTGPLAEWASTGIAPTPVLTAQLSSATENQPTAAEEETPVPIPKTDQIRTGNFSQTSRRKRQPNYVQEVAEEDFQPWFWRWKWALLAGFVGFALLILASCLIFLSQSGSRDRFRGTASDTDMGLSRSSENSFSGSKPVIVPTYVNPTSEAVIKYLDQGKQSSTNSVNTAAFKMPEANKTLSSTNAPAPSPPPQAILSTTPSVPKDVQGPPVKTNAAIGNPSATQVTNDKTLLSATAFGSLPQGAVYVILKNDDDLNTTTLPSIFATKLVAWNTACHYSVSKTGFVAPTNSSPTPTADKFALKFGGRTIYYNSQSIQIDNQTLDETLYFQFVKGDQTISAIIVSATNATHIFRLSKSLLNWSNYDISPNDALKKRLSNLFVYDLDGKPLSLQLIITTSSDKKTYFSDPGEYEISWKQTVQAAEARWDKDNEKLAKDQKGSQIESKINKIIFPSIDNPLTLSNTDVKSFATFLNSSDSFKIDSKEPLLVQYAKKLLSSLSSSYLNGHLILSFDDPTPPANWASWLKDVPSKLPNKLQGQGSIPDDQVPAFNQSVTAFCNAWTTTFTSQEANDLLNMSPDIITASLGSNSNLDADYKALKEDEKNKTPLHLEDIGSSEIAVRPSATIIPIIIFDSEDYHMMSDANSGTPK